MRWIWNLVLWGLVAPVAFAEPPKASSTKTDSATASEAQKKKEADSDCVKKQLENVYEYEKKFFAAHQKYSGDLKEAGVPQAVIEDCPGWSDPVARTSYGGMGFTVRSENKDTGEEWSINNEKGFIQESRGHGKAAK